MKSFIRIASLSNQLELGNPKATAEKILSLIDGAKQYNPDVFLFPSAALTGAQLGQIGYQNAMRVSCETAINHLLKQTRKLNSYLVVGGLQMENGKPVNAVYVLHRGQTKAILTESSCEQVFAVGSISFQVLPAAPDKLPQMIPSLSNLGALVTLIPTAFPAKAGGTEGFRNTMKFVSDAVKCGIAVSGGCAGDTSFPYVYQGITGSFECGRELAFKHTLQGGIFTITDFDSDIICAEKAKAELPVYAGSPSMQIDPEPHGELLRPVDQDPYLPQDPGQRSDYLMELFQLQSVSLAARLQHIRCEKVVIGVSGGLDSTLALLVCSNAFAALNLPKANITAITMQGFGTSGSTYQNALTLMSQLGCTVREIPIRDSVLQHFKDIGQDPELHDITYENAQARERTQILLDVANQIGGIVVGTGDLSEEALGFATFAGDHMANFNVNTCVTKTMIRHLVAVLAQTSRFKGCSAVLEAILNTPVSPELLPPDESGVISQKTEEILGPYLLHDFFLYYFVKYHFSPSKIYHYAKKAFAGQYDGTYLKEKLTIFFKRFCSSQFKRSCTPDSAVITDINLSNAEFFMPSDMNTDLFIKEIDHINLESERK